jgi:cytochrome c biogenesis protein CcmG, thiol:disulfide interchange protein DsbE
MRRWLPFAPLAVIVLLGVLFAGYALHQDPEVRPEALVGQPLPSLPLPTLGGGEQQPLREAARGPALLNVFASWCQPCVAENPELLRLAAAGARIVGVAYKDEPANTLRFLDQRGNPYEAILVDRSGEGGIELGVSGVPETYLVDRDGVVVAKHSGPLERADADRLMDRLKALR